jgi:signal transduction histidine kinase
MVSDILINKIVGEILPLASGNMSESEIGKRFEEAISAIFGVEKVHVTSIYGHNPSDKPIEGYLMNTKHPYVDNELSEYSAFPDLISYMNMGYKSYSAVPVIAGGEVIMYIEMLSTTTGRFTQELLAGVGISAVIIGNALAYKGERARSTKLAEYFDAAFNSSTPQVLVSPDGTMIKVNKSAKDELKLDVPSKQKLKEVLGISDEAFGQAVSGKPTSIMITDSINRQRPYLLRPTRIGESLIHVGIEDQTAAQKIAVMENLVSGSAETCTMLLTPSFIVNDASSNFERLFKCNKDAILNNSLFDYVNESDKNNVLRLAKEFKDEKDTAQLRLALLLESREPEYVHAVMARSLNGYVLMLVKADAEKYIIDMKQGFDYFISNTSDIVLIVDSSGYIKDCNLPAENVLKYPKAELVGKDIAALYKDKDILERDISYVRKGGFADNSYIDIIRKDGTHIAGTHAVRSLKSADGYSDYMIVIKELETRRHMQDMEKLEQQMKNQMAALKKESEQKAQFVYNISHELKTPLTSIKGFAKLLKEGEFGSLNEEQASYMQTILDESDRLMLIIQQVLDASKLDANKVKADIREMDFREIVNNASIKSLEKDAIAKGLEFIWTVDFDTPKIYADTNRIAQVLVNLIGNAVKFTEKGSIRVRVYRNGKSRSARSIRCDVTDTGIGISEEAKSKLFKKFYQAPKKELERQDGAGTGLGLSISWYIIKKMHGGDIKCESQLGKGSTFWFTLPVNPRPKA